MRTFTHYYITSSPSPLVLPGLQSLKGKSSPLVIYPLPHIRKKQGKPETQPPPIPPQPLDPIDDFCGICNTEVKNADKALICDRCNKWIHTKTKCNKLTKKEYQHHALNPEAPFECKKCRQCGLCHKTIAKNHKFLNCTECNSKVHIKCNKLTENDQKYSFDNPCFSCKSCLEQNLPLQQLDDYKFRLTVDGINYPDETDPTQMLLSESQLEMLNKFNKAIDDITSDLNSDKDDDSDEIKPVDCKYYTTDELKGLKIKTDKHSSILHMNITSIQFHIEELRIILKNLNHTFDYICITESKIKINNEPLVNIQIEGYQPPEGMPTYSKKGGTLIYIRNGIDYKPRLDLNMHKEKEIESFFIEEINPRGKNNIIGTIY